MPVEVIEKFESRSVTLGRNPSAELLFDIHGTSDDAAARAALLAQAPTLFDLYGGGVLYLPRLDLRVERAGDQLWHGEVLYALQATSDLSILSFDTTGGTQHITQNLATVGRYAPAGQTAIDTRGAIGATEGGVAGIDIPAPVYKWAERHVLPGSQVTPAFRAILYYLTGRVNDSLFRNFQAGECRFLGALGNQRGDGDWEVDFSFEASPNATNLTVGDITGIDKKGWEYLEVHYADTEDQLASVLVKRPMSVTVHQVLHYGDFSLLGI